MGVSHLSVRGVEASRHACRAKYFEEDRICEVRTVHIQRRYLVCTLVPVLSGYVRTEWAVMLKDQNRLPYRVVIRDFPVSERTQMKAVSCHSTFFYSWKSAVVDYSIVTASAARGSFSFASNILIPFFPFTRHLHIVNHCCSDYPTLDSRMLSP